MCLQAKDGFDLDGGRIDANGGEGGIAWYYYSSTSYDYNDPTYSWGGRGGRGAVTLVAGAGKAPEVVNAGNVDLGEEGTVSTGTFALTKDGISQFMDTGATAPSFTSVVFEGAAIATLYVEGCQSDPDTGGPDLLTRTGWREVADLSDLNGYRWIRFWVELEGTTVPGKAPEVDRVVISHTSKQ
jgi:hypothetical protein